MTDFVAEVNADRSAMDSYAARIDGLDAPGDMGRRAVGTGADLRPAQQRDERNRRQAANRARRRRRRQSDCRDRPPDAEAARRRRPLRDRRAAGNRQRPRRQRDRAAATCRRASSCPKTSNGWKKTPSRRRSARSAAPAAPTPRACTAPNSPGSASTAPNWAKKRRRSPAEETPGSRSRRSKTRANRPRTASASRSRSAVPNCEGSIETIGAGETSVVSIPLTPTPSGEATLEVKVDTVPGEQVSENNEASFTVVFE